MSNEALAPIIIKKKKVSGGDGHHGGAWKVAYADFVTAMMAFFLLMWLLNATTEKQRKGLADYFSPALPLSRISGGGDGSHWGESVFSDKDQAHQGGKGTEAYPSANKFSDGAFGLDSGKAGETMGGANSIEQAEQLLEELKARGGESMAALSKQRHVITRLSDEGLVIDIFEGDDYRLFNEETAQPTPLLLDTVRTISELLRLVTNDVAIEGHLPSAPLVRAQNPVWDLSTARAHAVRTHMKKSGFDPARLQRITGHGDKDAIDENPMARRNSRIEIIVLRDDL